MKKNWQVKVFILTLAISLIACQTVMGLPSPADDDIWEASPQESVPQQDAPLPPPEAPSLPADGEQESCLEGESYHPNDDLCYRDDGSAEPLFIAMMDGVTDYDESFEEKLLDDEYILVKYVINGNEITAPEYESVDANLKAYQDDIATQERIWAFYAAMIPSEARSFLTHYIVITDGLGGGLAAVEQTPDNPATWMLNVDIADTENLEELTFTLIHEYGHLLTLNANQVDVDEYIFNNPDDEDAYYDAEEDCPTYFTGEGCAKSSSYFYLFFDTFWRDIYDEWNEIQYIEDDDEYYEALDEFYFDYESDFVTDYAVTNPGEDIAESWAFFITQAKPAGNTIAEKKVLFFYQFPELVALRDEIIARGYSRLIRMR